LTETEAEAQLEDGLLSFRGKTILVVGGSSGIGNGIAQAFLRQGGIVYVCGTRAAAADYRADAGSDLTGLGYNQLNVADFAAIAAWQPPFERLDVLVLAQGAVEYGQKEFELETFTSVFDVNLHSLMACSMKFREMLLAGSGSIIIVSSTAAYHANVGNPAYNASKAAAVALTRNLGAAWARDGIRVNGIAPGFVATKMTAVTTSQPKRLATVEGRIPIGRVGTPNDMAGAAMFLASPLASYIVGQTLPIDGGLMHV
jgi:3-oxoacyl-[acyl-carrier protein] reductase